MEFISSIPSFINCKFFLVGKCFELFGVWSGEWRWQIWIFADHTDVQKSWEYLLQMVVEDFTIYSLLKPLSVY